MAKPRLLNMSGKIVPYEDARVHVLSTAMKYAASVYEAMRAYWSDADQQLYVFRLREHLRRLERSAKIARIRGSGLFGKIVTTDSHPRAVALANDFLEVASTAQLLVEHLIANR